LKTIKSCNNRQQNVEYISKSFNLSAGKRESEKRFAGKDSIARREKRRNIDQNAAILRQERAAERKLRVPIRRPVRNRMKKIYLQEILDKAS